VEKTDKEVAMKGPDGDMALEGFECDAAVDGPDGDTAEEGCQ